MKLFLLFSLIRKTEKKMREKIICVLSILLKYVWKLIRWIQHWISFLFFLYIPFGSINYVCADWNEYIYKKGRKQQWLYLNIMQENLIVLLFKEEIKKGKISLIFQSIGQTFIYETCNQNELFGFISTEFSCCLFRIHLMRKFWDTNVLIFKKRQ